MPRFSVAILLLLSLVAASFGGVVINEVMNAPSERVVKWSSTNVPTLGTGTPWYAVTFDDNVTKGWQTGIGPFGFGTFTGGSQPIGTNPQTQMVNLTPTLYLRKTFTATAANAASTDPLQLQVSYNDGFIVYVNGNEVARRWAGPVNQIHYHDQPAYDPNLNGTTEDNNLTTETVTLGTATSFLSAGTNVIAVQALNGSATSTNFYFSGTLRIGGATNANLVLNNDQWKYFVGVVEPSGGVYDPSLLNSGKLSVPWAKTTYLETGWVQGAGPIGQGVAGLGTTVSGVVGVTPSLYTRIVFNVTDIQAADATALQLLIDYDDSYVAYINGVEVSRANLQTPNTFTPRTAVSSATRNFGSTTTVTLDPANRLLVPGANVLAVQVHNVAIGDSDIAVKASLQIASASPVTLVANNSAQWKYFIGTQEPVFDPDGAEDDSPDLPDSVVDWVELFNNGAAAVSLNGWTLTDDGGDTAKWAFPNISIPAGGYLLVLCDGLDITAPAGSGYLHTNFKLSADGEYLGLYNGTGTLVQEITPVPKGFPHYSYMRNASGQYVYSDLATPGTVNSGNEFSGFVATPSFGVAGGYYSGSQSVTLTTTTVGATIRYTDDGSEPLDPTNNSNPRCFTYSGAVAVAATKVIRARAYLTGRIPSDIAVQNYLINEGARANLPSVALTATESRSLYRPFGVMAINKDDIGAGKNFDVEGNPWVGLGDPAQYNNPNVRGKCMERPVNWQMLYPGNVPGFNINMGLRLSGSAFTRPRYTLVEQNRDTAPNSGGWSATNALRKPSMNFYMRDDLSGDPLNFPVIPLSPVTKHSDFRFRAGHNDLNPFILDELVRRLYADEGQPSSLGLNVNLYINGIYKGIYNICEHVREEWCRERFGSDLNFDVMQVAIPSDGDLIAMQELITFLRNNPQSVLANYQGTQARLNMVNFVDYVLVNVYCATGDWPHNNWIAARERSTTGKFHFMVWDAEGAFGNFGLNVRSNCFLPPVNSGIIVTPTPNTDAISTAPRIIYSLLRSSPEFRLLCADRIQKHFFNGGALSDTAVLARNTALANEASPFVSGFNSSRIPQWVSGVGDKTRYTIAGATNTPSRRQVLLNGYVDDTAGGVQVHAHFVDELLWPATLTPVFSQQGGTIGANFQLTITNPNGVGSIYYTTNGTDPRQAGGAAVGTLYSGPVSLPQTTTVRARVLNSNGEWSPVNEATFVGGAKPALLITEIMYHPPDVGATSGSEYEFIEIKNVGSTTIPLFGMRFTAGIDYAFPAGASIDPAGFVVLAKNPTLFAQKYPGVPVLGGYGPSSSLDNAGETVTLSDVAGNVIFSVTYDDKAPWPTGADGGGSSLVPNYPNINPNPNDASNWRLSAAVGGTPGADDPAPGLPKVQISELLANSVLPDVDAVELFNPETSPANIGGWYLSDDLVTPQKYRIPDNTVIPAGGYLVLYETAFNPGPGPNSFAFSQNGDEAVLSSADVSGNLTGYTEFVKFGASDPGVTFGRYTNTEASPRKFFLAQKTPTLGAPNAGPKIGPVVFTEIQYFPTGSSPEFLEIQNISNSPVPLFDPENPSDTWRVAGINFSLPTGITLQPGQFLLISGNSPAAFRAIYGLPDNVLVYGPFTPAGDLDNASEKITLQKPGTPFMETSGTLTVPYIDVEQVTYAVSWGGNGTGRSLERVLMYRYGDDKSIWRTSSASGGNPARFSPNNFSTWQVMWFTNVEKVNPAIGGTNGDPDGDGLSNFAEFAHGLSPYVPNTLGVATSSIGFDGANGPYLMLSFRRSLSLLSGQVTWNVEIAGDLPNWITGAVQVGQPVNNGDGTETVTYRDNVILPNAGQRFMRVRPQ